MSTLITQNKTTSLVWLAAWTIASAIGIAVGFVATLPLIWSVSEGVLKQVPQFIGGTLAGAFFGFGVGLATGFAQWLVLRMRGESNPRWLIASIIGGIGGGIVTVLIGMAINDGGENVILIVIGFVLFGAIFGGVQYGMARAVVPNAAWILVSALGLALGAIPPFGLAGDLGVVTVVVGGLLYGLITAAAMWWFSKQ